MNLEQGSPSNRASISKLIGRFAPGLLFPANAGVESVGFAQLQNRLHQISMPARIAPNPLKTLVGPAGLEPATTCLEATGQSSNHSTCSYDFQQFGASAFAHQTTHF